MLLFTFLSFFFVFPSSVLAVTFTPSANRLAPNTSVFITWIRDNNESGPLHFTLSLTAPDGSNTTQDVTAEAEENHGEEKMSVGPPGSYSFHAASLPPTQSAFAAFFPLDVVGDAATQTHQSAVIINSSGSITDTLASTTTPSPQLPDENQKKSATPLIAGVISGSAVIILAICAIILIYRRRRRHRARRQLSDSVCAEPYLVKDSSSNPTGLEAQLPNSIHKISSIATSIATQKQRGVDQNNLAGQQQLLMVEIERLKGRLDTESAETPSAQQAEAIAYISDLVNRIASATAALSTQPFVDGQLISELERWTERYEDASRSHSDRLTSSHRRTLPRYDENESNNVLMSRSEPPPYPFSEITLESGHRE